MTWNSNPGRLAPAQNCLFQWSPNCMPYISVPFPQVALQPLQIISGSQIKSFSHSSVPLLTSFPTAILLFSTGYSSEPNTKIIPSIQALITSLQLPTKPHIVGHTLFCTF